MSDTTNQNALLGFITRQTGARSIVLHEFRQLSGGAIQENHGMRVTMEGGQLPGEHAFVIRADAPTSVAASLTRQEEFAVLQVAWDAGVKAPRPFWLCTDTTLIGREFYVMQWVEGSAAPASLVRDDALTDSQRQALMHQLGTTLGKLHKVVHAPGLLSFLAPPAGNPARRRIAECRQALADMGHARPLLALALSCLEAYVPEDDTWVLCHRDFRTGNYMVHDSQLTALLDWEFAAWSHPAEDIGWMSARCWRFGQTQRDGGGVGSRADLLAAYRQIAGHQPDPATIAWWETLACVRWAVIALQQAGRHLSGQEPSLELALTGRLVPEIEQDALFHLRALLSLQRLADGAEDTASTADSIPPVPGRMAGGEALDMPDGPDLLQTARSVLLTEVLPVTPPGQHYALRMAARAMGIALREIESREAVQQEYLEHIRQFYARAGLDHAQPSVRQLVSDIEQQRFDDARLPDLLGLMDRLLDLQLQLSNPRRMGLDAKKS